MFVETRAILKSTHHSCFEQNKITIYSPVNPRFLHFMFYFSLVKQKQDSSAPSGARKEKAETVPRNHRYPLRSSTPAGVVEQRSDQERNTTRFKRVTTTDIKDNQERSVPANTLKQNQWAINLLQKWRNEMIAIIHVVTETKKR